MAALALFLVTSLFGRLWCGYACPQTVWTDLYIYIERAFEGDRNARMRLDAAPWSFDKLWRKGGKHAVWLGVAFGTGGAWIFYFRDAPTLLREFWTGQAPISSYVSCALLTATTLRLRRPHARTGLHLHVPVAAHPGRDAGRALAAGDLPPRSRRAARSAQEGASLGGPGRLHRLQRLRGRLPDGHRHPQRRADGVHQLRPLHRRLRRDHGPRRSTARPDRLRHRRAVAERQCGRPPVYKPVRPRTIYYAAALVLVSGLMAWGLATRSALDLHALRDRNPTFIRLHDGSIRNAYTLKIANRSFEAMPVVVRFSGVPGARVSTPGEPAGAVRAVLPPNEVSAVRVFVTSPADALAAPSLPAAFEVRASRASARAKTVFLSDAETPS
jgi:polyferredoxin